MCVAFNAFGDEATDSNTFIGGPMAGGEISSSTPQQEEVVQPTQPRTPAPQRGGGGGPRRTLSSSNLCNSGLSIESTPETPTANGRGVATCEMMLDDQFAEALQKYIPLCAKSAAASQHWAIPTHVTVQQMGGFADRKINTPSGEGDSWSRHSVGKALDISALIMNHGGPSYKIDLTDRTQNQSFYDAFRTCWDNSMKSFLGQNCTCSIGHPHTHPPSNELHNNHMHISLTCPTQPNVAGC